MRVTSTLAPAHITPTPAMLAEAFNSIGEPLTPPMRQLSYSQDALLQFILRRLLAHLLGGALILVIERNVAQTFSLFTLSYAWILAVRVFSSSPAALNNPLVLQNYPWRYGALTLYTSVAMRDPALLLTWAQTRLQNLSLFQHQQYFRVLGSLLQGAVTAPLDLFCLAGVHLYVAGKISVVGNARSRSYYSFAGRTGAANLALRVTRSFILVRTRTGCLGVTLQFYF